MYDNTRKLIRHFTEDGTLPGASYAFINQQGTRQYREGLAALIPHQEPIRENQQYDVASLTKVMLTTTVILQLLENRALELDAFVQTYLPDFSADQVTLRHLLTHTSGLNGFIPNRNALSASELKAALLNLPVDDAFGKKVKYTDTNMILLGYIIENIEDETLSAVFEKRIIHPLNLLDSTFHPTDPTQCAPTENQPDRGVIRGVVHDPKALVLGDHCGSAGLFSTLNDVSRFSQMLLQKGQLDGVRILQESTVEQLTQDWTPNGRLERSLGWDLKISEHNRYLFHTGFTGTFMLLDIKEQTAFVFLSNRVHPTSDTLAYLKKRDQLIETYFLEKETEAR